MQGLLEILLGVCYDPVAAAALGRAARTLYTRVSKDDCLSGWLVQVGRGQRCPDVRHGPGGVLPGIGGRVHAGSAGPSRLSGDTCTGQAPAGLCRKRPGTGRTTLPLRVPAPIVHPRRSRTPTAQLHPVHVNGLAGYLSAGWPSMSWLRNTRRC
jgi:hypothetical protein